MKKCKSCNQEKTRESFYRLRGKQYKSHWDCRDSYCIPCRKIYSDKRRKLIKKQAVQYLGSKCVECGLKSDQYCIYDFHHVGTKDFAIGKQNKSFNSIKDELDKCELLCSNCHRVRHVIDLINA